MKPYQCSFAAFAAVLMLAISPTPQAQADGALAVGVPSGGAKEGFAYGRTVNRPSQAVARQKALELCRHAKNANDVSRERCTLVESFHRQCVAVAMDPANGTPGVGWAIAPTRQAAEQQAVANCRATAGPSRQQFCKTDDSVCDVKN